MMTNRNLAAASFSLILLLTPTPQAAAQSVRLGVYRIPSDLAREAKLSPRGAAIYRVITASAAGKAGLEPGDVITLLDDEPVRNFDDLRKKLRGFESGQKLTIRYLREGKPRDTTLIPTAWTGELTTVSYEACLEYLTDLALEHDGPVLQRELIINYWLSGQRSGALEELESAIEKFPKNLAFAVQRLEMIRKLGRFEEYCRQAGELADRVPLSRQNPVSLDLHLAKAEALLATGKLDAAEKLAAQIAGLGLRLFYGPPSTSLTAIRIWAFARLWQGKPLAGGLSPVLEKSDWNRWQLGGLGFWRKQLGNRKPYRIVSQVKSTELDFESSGALLGLVKLYGIPIEINATKVPLAIIDTGASHTVISVRTARKAAVVTGSVVQTAAGALSFDTHPGLIRELKIGEITLRNVPVNVGNPMPLLMTEAEVALGVDLMHHLRFTIDYPRSKVQVQPAQVTEPVAPKNPKEVWDIPLWTFSEHTLSQGRLPNGSYARVLIDSGNFSKTLVWPTWAKENLSDHPGPTNSMLVYILKNPHRQLEGLTLGHKTLPSWYVADMPPVMLKGIDMVDLLMGHDLFSQYKVTVDFSNLRLRLESPGPKFQLPVAKKPFGADF